MPAKFYHPRYWLFWVGFSLLRLSVYLPDRVILLLSRLIGQLMWLLAGKRKQIARINIRLCFPEKTAQEQEKIVRAHIDNLALVLFETALCWWRDPRKAGYMYQWRGWEHAEQALAKGNGALMLCAHFSMLEIIALFMVHKVSGRHPIHPMYLTHKNPLLEYIIVKHREKVTDHLLAQDNVRTLIKVLKQNSIVWYAPDQAFGGKGSLTVPFFGIPASSNTATYRLVKLTKAPVLPLAIRRLPGQLKYVLEIQPPINEHCADEETTLAIYHRWLEEKIREAPEQYLWVHRRFKGNGEKIYD